MPQTFDNAWKLLMAQDHALRKALDAPTMVDGKRWVKEAQRAENVLFPAERMAAAKAKLEILREGRRWFQQQGSFSANISHCIKHLKDAGLGTRAWQGRAEPRPLSDSQIRKILRKGFEITGKRGRPRRS
jgi:signal transduction histidine kinase